MLPCPSRAAVGGRLDHRRTVGRGPDDPAVRGVRERYRDGTGDGDVWYRRHRLPCRAAIGRAGDGDSAVRAACRTHAEEEGDVRVDRGERTRPGTWAIGDAAEQRIRFGSLLVQQD